MRKLDFCIYIYTTTKAEIICAVTAQLISVFVFASLIVQFLFFLDLKISPCIILAHLYQNFFFSFLLFSLYCISSIILLHVVDEFQISM